ncbi:DNA cytosine methyltransferase [Oryzomonas sagensis]|uniref:DNA cytosine methyltransferase n=2 Tax=Oryzomonas sagensis TaxID=2603857 RepID=A0ABQ6TLL3_9BACT|nr:DNA cytosine methyltransferase [Oryzomonas sagensis]
MGYHRAGFDVTGVDINPQPRYPFRFIQGDALEYLAAHGHEFDAIHASPPCQAYTAMKTMPKYKDGHPDFVGATRGLLKKIGKPFVIENVPGSPLKAQLMLCGTMFGLGITAADLQRHRYFETSFDVGLVPCCDHRKRAIGVYGNAGGRSLRDGITQFSTAEWREAMGIDWMNGKGLAQAIPPAYTEWIGRQLMEYLNTL